ncbi:MAG TPA: hypothetical protein VGI38_11640 [Puia sp.]|jgi:tetratricopeptide (TPR) repeat protein
MDNLDYIENYFAAEPGRDLTREFEERIHSDPGFAEEVAFYLSALQVSRESSDVVKKEHFKEIYQKHGVQRSLPVRKLVYYMSAAAIVAAVIFGTYFFTKSDSPQQMADRYIKDQLKNLPVTMSSRSDSLQDGLRLYNDGKIADALAVFEKLSLSDDSNFVAKKYAGDAALRLGDYDKALSFFEQMATFQGLYSNPALLLQSLTLMKRDKPGDIEKAKQLLQKIVTADLEGKETAQEWLTKW